MSFNINWHFIVVTIIGLTVLISVILTFFYYIQFKKEQVLKRINLYKGDNKSEGRYFKRYLTDSLLDKYSNKQEIIPEAAAEVSKVKSYFRGTFVLAILLTCGLIGYYFYKHFPKNMAQLDLTRDEVESLAANHYKLKDLWNPEHPQDSDLILKNLAKKEFIILYDEKELHVPIPGTKRLIVKETKKMWVDWIKKNEFQYRAGDWESLHRYLSLQSNRIFVVLPGSWKIEEIKKIINKGHSLLLFGFPYQIFKAPFKFEDLVFEQFTNRFSEGMVLVGDRPTTIGLDAGRVLSLPAIYNQYRALYPDPDAYSIGRNKILKGEFISRIVARTIGDSRVVWTDFNPGVEGAQKVLNPIFRFLQKLEYRTVATWPNAHKMAGYISQTVIYDYKKALEISNYISQNEWPSTWLLQAYSAGKVYDIVGDIAKSAGVGCFGDDHQPFRDFSIVLQTQKLARCAKVLNKLTGKEVKIFYPPNEQYDSLTYSALINSGYNFLMGVQKYDRVVPQILTGQNKQLTIFGKIYQGDKEIFNSAFSTYSSAMLERILRDLEWVNRLGGLFNFNLNVDYFKEKDPKELLKEIVISMKKKDIYFNQLSKIIEWWELRAEILKGVEIQHSKLEQYKPYWLILGKDGLIKKEPI